MDDLYTKQTDAIVLPDPLPARHFAENAYANLARQYKAAKSGEERKILRGHLRYWMTVLAAWREREEKQDNA